MSKDYSYIRKSPRRQNWNYSWEGQYFFTVSTRFNENYFGEIFNDKMHLNNIGFEVEKQWIITPSIRPDMNITLDEFTIMPNHFHGIICIGKNEYNTMQSTSKTIRNPTLVDLTINSNPKYDENSITIINQKIEHLNKRNTFGPQKNNLSSVMRGFKSAVTSWCKNQSILFDWHPRYHDVIIRDENMLLKIRNYIRNNPKNWCRDRYMK
jgi:REP element-mobilizing transposase RayT